MGLQNAYAFLVRGGAFASIRPKPSLQLNVRASGSVGEVRDEKLLSFRVELRNL